MMAALLVLLGLLGIVGICGGIEQGAPLGNALYAIPLLLVMAIAAARSGRTAERKEDDDELPPAA